MKRSLKHRVYKKMGGGGEQWNHYTLGHPSERKTF